MIESQVWVPFLKGNDRSPIIVLESGEVRLRMLIDTGAMVCVINEERMEGLRIIAWEENGVKLVTLNGGELDGTGRVRIEGYLGPVRVEIPLQIVRCKTRGEYDGILGYDWLKEMGVKIIAGQGLEWEQRKEIETVGVTSGAWMSKASQEVPRHEELTEDGQAMVTKLCQQFKSVWVEEIARLPEAKVTPCIMEVETKGPIYVKQYPIPLVTREKLKALLLQYKEAGIVEESMSPHNSPICCINKKDGSIRMALDLRKINAHTKRVDFPMPKINEVWTMIGGSKYFSIIDLNAGYYQLPLARDSRQWFAFQSPIGKLQLTRLPQGAANSSFHFQCAMEQILQGMLYEGVICYLDDILIYSRTREQHMKLLREVLKRMEKYRLAARPSKTQLMQESVTFLGHLIDGEGIRPDGGNVKAMLDFPRPRTVKNIRAFCGMIGFYRHFIPRLSDRAKVLYELCKKNTVFKWTDECERAFCGLKETMVDHVRLKFPDYEVPFWISCDASGEAIGGVVEQHTKEGFRPVAFWSRTLTIAEKNYAIIEREALAIVETLKHFRTMIYGREIIVKSDHQPLAYLWRMRDESARMMRWALKLQEYSLKVVHVPGKANKVADMLSRGEGEVNCMVTKGIGSKEILKAQNNDPQGRKLTESGKLKDKSGYYIDGEGMIREKGGRIWVPEALRHKIIALCHNSETAGHFGRRRTRWKVSRGFIWKGMRKDVEQWVRSCDICQRAVANHKEKKKGDVIVADRPFQRVGMDVVGPLPRSKRGNKYILTCVDHFTRFPIAVPIKDQEANTLARAMFRHVFCEYGPSEVIYTDRGASFRSRIFKEACKQLGMRNEFTLSYRPQSNGIVERMNRSIVEALRKTQERSEKDWEEVLPLVIYALRSVPHEATGDTPNFLLRGYDLGEWWADHRLKIKYERTRRQGRHEWTQLREEVYERLREVTKKRRDKANIGLGEMSWKIGDMVLMQNEGQMLGKGRKLRMRYKGPYRIVKMKGPTTVILRDMQRGGNTFAVHTKRVKRYWPPEMGTEESSVDNKAKSGPRQKKGSGRQEGVDPWTEEEEQRDVRRREREPAETVPPYFTRRWGRIPDEVWRELRSHNPG